MSEEEPVILPAECIYAVAKVYGLDLKPSLETQRRFQVDGAREWLDNARKPAEN